MIDENVPLRGPFIVVLGFCTDLFFLSVLSEPGVVVDGLEATSLIVLFLSV